MRYMSTKKRGLLCEQNEASFSHAPILKVVTLIFHSDDNTDWGMIVYGSSGTDDAVSFSETAALPSVIGNTHEATPVVHFTTQEPDSAYLLLASAYNQVCVVY